MSAALTDNQTLLAFKAGRSFRRPGSNLIDASAAKGAVVLTNGEDSLLHFLWKERPASHVREDLILFPGDATFEEVSQDSTGRTYVLRFDSSNQKHFFWMQDASSSRDLEFVSILNQLLADPTTNPVWGLQPAPESQESSSEPSATSHQGSSSSHMSNRARGAQAAAPPVGIATPEQLARLRALVTSMGASSGTPASNPDDELALSDILTPTNLLPLFTSHPSLLPSLFPHLSPELLPQQHDSPLTLQQTAQLTDVLQRTVNSPPFRATVLQLDRALQTGALGGFVRSLGLPESAGTGVGAFLRAVAEQARREGSDDSGQEQADRMDEN